MKQKFINIRNDILDISYITKNGRLGTDFSVVESPAQKEALLV